MENKQNTVNKEFISKSMSDYMKLVEKQNLERVQRLQKIRRNNIITACILGTAVLGIYGYSMLSVKQETFLDDFEEPRKVAESNS